MDTGKIIEVKSEENKKWTVGCVYQVLLEKTVMAPTKDLALAAVKAGYGVHGGEYGPFLTELMIKETGTKDSEFDVKRVEAALLETEADAPRLVIPASELRR